VIYTHALPAEFAVIWSGFFNFLGVALSTGAVAAAMILSGSLYWLFSHLF
jgi:PiT family inorganic phosphate transporter